jgi:uncharacterized YigZ family protein
MLFSTGIYRSIGGPSEYLYKSRNSKFFAFCYPVHSETEIKEYLSALKNKYPDASHHCYAYVLHHDKSVSRANDDGEPANTAGKPILRQIQKLDLTNVLVVVVRYFGGTLLGVPGLIEAYGQAAAECLHLSQILEYKVLETYELKCPFGQEKDIYKLCKQFQINLSVKQNQECFCAEIKIPLQQTEGFKQQIKAYYQVSITYTGIE